MKSQNESERTCDRLRKLRDDLPNQVFESFVRNRYHPILDGSSAELRECYVQDSEFELKSYCQIPVDQDCGSYEDVPEKEPECDRDLLLRKIEMALTKLCCGNQSARIGFVT